MRCALTLFSAISPRVHSPALGSGKEHFVSTYPTLSAKRPNSYKRAEKDFKKEILPRSLSLFQQKAGKGNRGGGEATLHQIGNQKTNFSWLGNKLNSRQAAGRNKYTRKRERKKN